MATKEKSKAKSSVSKDAVPVKKIEKFAKKQAAPTKKDTKDSSAKPSLVKEGHYIAVEYTGTLDNGEEFDSSKNNGPIQFVVGSAQVIKGFDDAVRNMKVGEEKTFRIAKQEAYGDINPELQKDFPLNVIPEHIKSQLKVGGFLVLQAPTGQQIPSKVVKMDKDKVTLDMNHPLAGKDLTFKIKIVDISADAPKEACGCGDDSCGDDCGCGEGDDSENDSCGCGHKH